MSECEQTQGQTILEHGLSVHRQWLHLLDNPCEDLEEWWPQLLADISKHDPEKIKAYHIYHDCGKPLCIEFDEDGKRHFPNHAQVSYETWLAAGGDTSVAEWILHDMDIHTCSANDLEVFQEITGSEVLLLTGLAEIQANAEMFGGKTSEGYKIKYKRWLKRARAYLKRRYHG